MVDDALAYASANEVLELYRGRRLSPVEYLDASIERMNAVGPLVNAFAATYLDEAREAAQRAEQVYGSGSSAVRSLEGLLVAIKDETPVAGKVTTVGSLVHDPSPEAHDAVVVERLRQAGAIVLGRTTTPEFCGAPFTHSRLWGVTRNPWNPDFSPGGSSGGAAAALAAGLVPLADGSDIAGSVRIPASFCGVVGFKPPYGRVPGIPLYNLDTYNHQGPLARTVADCALMQDVMSGPDPRDVATVPSLVTVSDVEADVRGLRIAVSEDMGGFNCDEEIRAAVRLAAERFRGLGAIVEQVEVGWTVDQVQRAARAHYKAAFGAEMDEHARQHPEKLTPYILEFIDVLSASDASYLQGLETEARVHAGLMDVFADYDLLVGPVLTTTGFIAGEDYVDTHLMVNGRRVEHWLDTLPTMVFNIGSRHPVAVVPVTRAANGVPIGLQIAGRTFDDRTVFRAAKAFEAQDPWFAARARRPALLGSAPAPS
jgi:Asp-tRNA(Asn)/Glu-tRNA(Gln) amidotransferase A subunit family amidase